MSILSRAKHSTATEAVADQLRRAILSGTFEPGSQLPTEIELVDMLGVSRATLRESLRTLEDQGLILRRHGVGTFVRSRAILKNLSINYGITDMISSAGLTAGTSHLKISEQMADEEMAESLKIEPDCKVIVVERVRTADGQPVVYSLDIFPSSLLKGKPKVLRSLGDRSMYEYLQTESNLTIHHGIAKLVPVGADDDLSHHLNVRHGTPLLYILQVDYLSEDHPILLSHEYHIADAFEVIVYRSGPGGAV